MDPRPDSRQIDARVRALEALLANHRKRLLRQAQRHTTTAEDPQDVVGDAVVRFLRSYDGPAGEDALHWMLKVVKNRTVDIGRSASAAAQNRRSPHQPEELADDGLGPAEALVRSEEMSALISFLDRLKPDERTALIRVSAGYSYAEIADGNGWTLTKVRRCVYEGRTRLRELSGRGGIS